MHPVSRDLSGVGAAITQGRLGTTHQGKALNSLKVDALLREGVGFAPERFAHPLRGGASARQALLGPVVQAGDAWQAEEAARAQRDLVVVRVWLARVSVEEAPVLVVVLHEGHKQVAD